MKIMATSCASEEHLFPLLPTLWALRNAGHDVLLALPAPFAQTTAATGLPTTSVAEDIDTSVRQRPEGAATVNELADHIIEHYLPISELCLPRTVELAESWQPDLVLCSDWEYAGPIAAARIGAPTVLHGRGMFGHPTIGATVSEALKPLHRRWGLNDGPPEHWRIIDNCPPSVQWIAMPPNTFGARYVSYHRPAELPSWVFERPEVPRVLVSLSDDPLMRDKTSVLEQVLRALLPLDVEVVVASSEQLGGDKLVELPSRTRLTHGLPLSHLVPTCSVVITDGAPGSVLAAVTSGVPQLGLPQVPGQYQHADRIAEVGAGLCLDPDQASTESITAAVRTLLDELGQRAIARRIQVENTGRPALHDVARRLEKDLAARPRMGGRSRPGRPGSRPRTWQPSPDMPTTPVQGMTVVPLQGGKHSLERIRAEQQAASS